MSNFNQISRRDFVKASSAGAALAVSNLTLPFNVMAKETQRLNENNQERIVWCIQPFKMRKKEK